MLLYTQPGCRPCDRIKSMLDDAGLDYELVDISKDAIAADYVKRVLRARSTPIIEMDGWEPVIGYDGAKELIDALRVQL